MAKKDTKAAPAKTVKSAGARSPNGAAGSRPTANRRPTKPAPDTPSSDTVEIRAAGTGNSRADLSPEEVYRLIQETAYYKAKARGFAPGHEVQDWIEAEAEVRSRLESRA
ncbi:MAG TPA: DUF2934 domain-containing protein [Burkholderiales bacterium]|nr:DUF2934 domain-containing protein [Burkholderiales bacterium]